MYVRRLFSLVLSFVAIAFSQPANSADCRGNAMLTLRESQGGFAGKTGTVWTINSDCSFTVSRFVNDQTSEPQNRGQLTPEQISSLSRLLSEQMPTQIGDPAPVNPRQITLTHDSKTSVLNLALGATDVTILNTTGAASPERRMIEILQAVKKLTGTD
jgi:hypothetical protein